MKRSIKTILLITLSVFIVCFCMIGISAAETDSLKVLAIGNSFSEDTTEYLAIIASDVGIENTVIGNAYIGGCNLEKHANNAKNNSASYSYYKNTEKILMSVSDKTQNTTLDTILRDEAWDIVTLQQSSPLSGREETYNSDIDYLVEYVKERCPNAKLAWNMTWAYQSNYTSSSFSYYGNDQLRMYNDICNAVREKIVKSGKFDYIIPAGTAIQNARTSEIGDTLTRDGLHLSYGMGRYITGVTWIRTFGYSLDGLSTLPSRVRKTDLPFVKEVVENAIISPFKVTQYGTSAETEPETAVQTEEQTETQRNETASSKTDTQQPSDNQQQQSNSNNPVLIIGIVCAVIAVIVAAIIVFKKFLPKK